MFGGSAFGIEVPRSKNCVLAPLHPEGQGGDTRGSRVADKSGSLTVAPLRTRRSCSPPSVLTARRRFICRIWGRLQKQPTPECGGQALTEAQGRLIKEKKGQEEELRAPAGPPF